MTINQKKRIAYAILGLTLTLFFSCTDIPSLEFPGRDEVQQRYSSSSSEVSSSAQSSSSAYLCNGTQYNPSTQLCDDRDGKIYKLATIGNQTWMAKNLNYVATSSKCGGVKNSSTIEDEFFGTITYYPLENSETTNCITYGRLYNWETAISICPGGSHLPDSTEWKELLEKFTDNPTDLDNSGFAALPGGVGNADLNGFVFEGSFGSWWSASEEDNNNGWDALISYDNRVIEHILWGSNDKSTYLSVRCIKDPPQTGD